jgi:hypothetical protein
MYPSFSQIIPGCDEYSTFLAADINCDGTVNISDATIILDIYVKKAAGIE